MSNETMLGRGIGEPINVDRFKILLPTADISEIPADQVPEATMTWFEGRSTMLIHPEDYKPGNFERFFVINHEGGDTTYAAQQTKTYGTNGMAEAGYGNTENLIHLIDQNTEGNKTGHGEIRFNISSGDAPYFKDKPFAGYISTELPYQRRGLGTRLLFTMAALSEAVYGLPLHSDTTITAEARSLLDKVVAQGKATKYLEGKHERYVITPH